MPPRRRAAKKSSTTIKSVPESRNRPEPATPPPSSGTPPPSVAETPVTIDTPALPASGDGTLIVDGRCVMRDQTVAGEASSLPTAAHKDVPLSNSAAVAEQFPSTAESSVKPTVKKVRKVIVKKIIRKIVPKGTLAAKRAAEEAAKAVQEPASAVPENLQVKDGKAKGLTPSSAICAADEIKEINGDLVVSSSNDANKATGLLVLKDECKLELTQAESHKDHKTEQRSNVVEGSRSENDEKMMKLAVKTHEDVKEGTTEPSDDFRKVVKEENPVPPGDTTVGTSELSQDHALDGEIEKEAEGEEGLWDRRRRRRTEVFIGGLNRSATEEDVRDVFGKAGEIVEIRMIMDLNTGRNKGYCFVRYKDATQAKRAATQLSKVEVCGKLCGAVVVDANDTLFFGNIDKGWAKEHIFKLLEEIGIPNIDTVSVLPDINNPGRNRGFAFLEFKTNRDAQLALKKLQTDKFALDKLQNVTVSWATPLKDPDEEELQKVKTVFVEGIPSSWDQAKMAELFQKFGDVDTIVLSRDIVSAKRKDYAFVNYTTREAAMSCIESFHKENLMEGCSKDIRVLLAKPVNKSKKNKGAGKSKGSEREKQNAAPSKKKFHASSAGKMPSIVGHTAEFKTFPTNSDLVLSEKTVLQPWRTGYATGPSMHSHAHTSGEKRVVPAWNEYSLNSDLRGQPRPRTESYSYLAETSSIAPRLHHLGQQYTSIGGLHHNESYGYLPETSRLHKFGQHGAFGGSSYAYYPQRQGATYHTSDYHRASEYPTMQARHGSAPFGSRPYPRY